MIFLIRSVRKIFQVYQNPNRVVISAKAEFCIVELKQTGFYEIAVKRRGLFTVVPSKPIFRLSHLQTKVEIPLKRDFNLLSQRKDGFGVRIVPVAEFEIKQAGIYRFEHLSALEFKADDELLLMPKTGLKGFILIFSILISGALFIAGLVLSILFINKG
ncbi:MAG: hypothetical protein ACKOW2_01295 [Sphingobacteriaceae bacterium]